MELGVANDRREQETDGSSECDSTSIHVNLTCTTEGKPNPNARNTMQNDNTFEIGAENRNFTEQFETNGQTNTNNVLNSSKLIKNENCDFKDVKQKANIKMECNNLSGNMSNSSVKTNSFKNMIYKTMVSIGLFIVGGTVMVLNLMVIIVVYSTPKLRRNTYLNLVLSLSVTDFLFGFSTFFNGIRKSLESILSNGDFKYFWRLL